MIKAKELIEQLKKFDENAIVIVSGCYGSTSGSLYNIHEVDKKEKAYLGYTDTVQVICIASNICSG